jgi:hypothetical protein
MRKIHFITYADHNFAKSGERLCEEAKAFGEFDTVKILTPDYLPEDFKNEYEDILKIKKGGGYYIWKPKIIYDTLVDINDSDLLLYLDAGFSLNINGKKRFNKYVSILKNYETDIIAFPQPAYKESEWTTKEVFGHFNIFKSLRITYSPQYSAGCVFMRNSSNTRRLFHSSLVALEVDRQLFTDYYAKKIQCSGFKAPRHDQSIFSCLYKSFITEIFNKNEIDGNGKSFNSEYPFWDTRIRE